MEENEKQITTSSEISVEEESKMETVANSRVRFKIHLSLFVIVNLVIWVLFFTLFNAIVTDPNIRGAILKVFIFITLAWLLIVILHYCIAYKWNKTFVEKELKRVKKQRVKQLAEIEKLKTKMAETKAKQEANKQ